MDDLARDFGFRPQGKSAPMRSDGSGRGSASVQSSPFNDDHDGFLFNDAYGGTSKYTSTASTGNKSSSVNDYDYDSIFKTSSGSNNVTSDSNNSKTSSFPVYDKPVYDDVYEDDIFQGLPGLKSKSVSSSTSNNRVEENIFASMVSPPKNNRSDKNDHFDDLLGNFGGSEKVKPEPKSSVRSSTSQGGGEFDDLLGGFGSGSSTSGNRSNPGPVKSNPGPGKSKQTSSSVMNDPFAGLETTSTPGSSYGGVFTDPLEEISKLGKFETKKADPSPVSGGVFDDLDPLNGFGKSIPPFSPEKDQSPSRSRTRDHSENLSFNHSQKKTLSDNFHEAPLFDMPSVSTHSNTTFAPQNVTSPPPYENVMSPKSEDQAKFTDEIWLTVSEIPLFTQPTKAPPPSRPPPPIPRQNLKADTSFFSSDTPRYTSSYSETPKTARSDIKTPSASQIDGLEDFAMGRTQNEHASEDMDAASAAMKDAMDRAEAKFKHAKEVKEREHAKARNKETVQTEDNEREQVQREKEEEEREKEQRRIERARQAEVERVRARQAVERATREARERAAQGAREKQAAEAKQRAEKIAVEKAQAEARERAGRVAVQRAQAEARERAANEAKERAEKAAAENREKDAKEKAEARRRAERASVDRATAEARDRAAAEARDRAAARTNQQRNDNDLDSFFSSRPNSVPKPRPTSYDPFFDAQTQGKGRAESASNKPTFTSVPTPNIRKVSSTTNIVDDLSSIFGASPQSGDFQDVEGETEERRRARLERHQRTQERAAKALAEKNQRDLQAQKDQEERHRHSEVLDSEIKRWAAGKEGNLRALLSTLQYVLWPECGWKPVSLTDLITGADVKKVYRRATLCIHPDKVQQKGATLQQKYIAEKVFDLLKEAWNKLNSEELF